jgi:hypothetical protein
MRAKMQRACTMPDIIVDRPDDHHMKIIGQSKSMILIKVSVHKQNMNEPGWVRMMAAADCAASVAPFTATPTSARFSAGASFTPSPVMPTCLHQRKTQKRVKTQIDQPKVKSL